MNMYFNYLLVLWSFLFVILYSPCPLCREYTEFEGFSLNCQVFCAFNYFRGRVSEANNLRWYGQTDNDLISDIIICVTEKQSKFEKSYYHLMLGLSHLTNTFSNSTEETPENHPQVLLWWLYCWFWKGISPLELYLISM